MQSEQQSPKYRLVSLNEADRSAIVLVIGVGLALLIVNLAVPTLRSSTFWYNVSNTTLAVVLVVFGLLKYHEAEKFNRTTNVTRLIERVEEPHLREALVFVETYIARYIANFAKLHPSSSEAELLNLMKARLLFGKSTACDLKDSLWWREVERYLADEESSSEPWFEYVIHICNYMQDAAIAYEEQSVDQVHFDQQLRRFVCFHWIVLRSFVESVRQYSFRFGDRRRWQEFENLANRLLALRSDKETVADIDDWLLRVMRKRPSRVGELQANELQISDAARINSEQIT